MRKAGEYVKKNWVERGAGVIGQGSISRPSRRDFIAGGARLAVGSVFASSLLAACTTDTEKAGGSGSGLTAETVDTELIVHTESNVYFQQWIAGLEAAAGSLNLATHLGTSEGDVGKHISVLSDSLTRGAKIVNGVAPTDASILQIAQLANDSEAWLAHAHAHEPWVMVESLGKYYVQYHSFNEVEHSYQLGKALFEAVGGSGKVINIAGLAGHGASIQRTVGYRKAADELPGIEVVAEEYGNFNRVDTVPVFEGLLTAHPDVVAVTCASDDSAMGVISVLKDRGLKDVKVVGIDSIPEFLDDMSKGGNAFGTVSILGTWTGMWLAAVCFDAMHGVDFAPVERMVVGRSLVITGADAADAYVELAYADESNPPGDPELMSRALHPNDWQPQNGVKMFDPLDPDGWWLSRGDLAPKPEGWTPPDSWTESQANGDIERLNSEFEKKLTENDPWAELIRVPGVTAVL